MEEKRPLLSSQPISIHTPPPHQTARLRQRPILLLPLAIFLTFLFIPSKPLEPLTSNSSSPPPSAPSHFNWATISSPSPSFIWTPCYGGGLQCAKLRVPMDHFNSTTDATVDLAVVRRPAVVNVTHPGYSGAVLLNPGGPGAPGIDLVIAVGESVQRIIDADHGSSASTAWEGGKYFDVIGWDPRGTGQTEPWISCSEDEGEAWAWQLRVMEEGILGSSDAGLGRLWSMAKARGGSCSLPPRDGSASLKRYASTASTARDMVSIIEAHGEWREKEAARLLGVAPPGQRGPRKRIQVPQKLKWQRGGEKLQYWGFSYGTYLGMTFSAMFPDKVERVVVDGVVDPYDYRRTLWYDNLADTEKSVALFYEDCASAGYPTCALANASDAAEPSTPEGVRARVDGIISSLYHNPLAVIAENAEVITFSDVKNLIFRALYSPMDSFARTADLLADVEKGNGTRFAEMLKPAHRPSCGAAGEDTRSRLGAPNSVGDAMMIITCTDGDSQTNMTKEEFKKHLEREVALSPSIGAIWSTIRMQCAHFPLRAHHRFTRPFTANTSHPLLFIGNTADPVTPLQNAVKMAEAYEGSAVLTQDSPGHCSISAASRCTVGWLRGYFQTGELPPEETVCRVEERPFGNGDVEMGLSEEERDVVDVVKALRRGVYAAGGFY